MKTIKISPSFTVRNSIAVKAYLSEINKKCKRVSQTEELFLAQQIKKGSQDARKKLCESNLFFVFSVAKQHQGQGLDFPDLIQEGNLGLWEATGGNFDETFGFKFISYAVSRINKEILDSLEKNKSIVRLPANQIRLKNKIRKVEEKFITENERKPTFLELSSILNIPEYKIKEALSLNNSDKYVSLDESIGYEDEDYTLLNKINSDAESADSEVLKIDSEIFLCNLIFYLCSKRESFILIHSFGLNNEEPKTSLQIAEYLKLSVKEVNSIKFSTLQKLRSQKRRKFFKDYI